MYHIIVDALSMSQYFHGVSYYAKCGSLYDGILNKKDFDYKPKYYGIQEDRNRFRNFLIPNEEMIKSIDTFHSEDIFEYNEILTFEFETEEEAFYFQMKYGGEGESYL